MVLADAGHGVYVVIDDQGGQSLASCGGLTILTVEDLLIAAMQLGLLAPERLRKTQTSGSSLCEMFGCYTALSIFHREEVSCYGTQQEILRHGAPMNEEF